MSKFSLEIYEPNGTDSTLAIFSQDVPFGAISVGDLMQLPQVAGEMPGEVLQVTSVEHILWHGPDGKEPKHKVCVYTIRLQDTRELRHPD